MVLAYHPQLMKKSLIINSNYPPQGINQTPIIMGEQPIAALYPPIADNTFQFYRFYQIKKNQVTETHANVPLVIIEPSFPLDIIQNPSGFDIRVFNSAGDPLDYEIAEINISGFAVDFILWFKMGTVAEGEIIQLTFGKPAATDGSNPASVWSDKLAVYHMNDNTDSVGLNDLTDNGTNSTSGQIGGARGFVGAEFMTSNVVIPGDVGWISCWVNPFNTIQNQYLVNVASNKYAVILGFQNNNFNFFSYPTGTPADTQFSAVNFQYQKIDVVTNGSGTTQIYKNGVLIHDVVDIIDRSGSTSLFIGTSNGSLNFADANIDEVNIANVFFPDMGNRIAAIFNNQNDNDTFWFKTPILENGVDNLWADESNDIVTEAIP